MALERAQNSKSTINSAAASMGAIKAQRLVSGVTEAMVNRKAIGVAVAGPKVRKAAFFAAQS